MSDAAITARPQPFQHEVCPAPMALVTLSIRYESEAGPEAEVTEEDAGTMAAR